MDVNQLITTLKEYDFIKNSISSFQKEYGVNPKTIKKYLNLHSIPYNTKVFNVVIPRDSSGRYTIKPEVLGIEDSVINTKSKNMEKKNSKDQKKLPDILNTESSTPGSARLNTNTINLINQKPKSFKDLTDKYKHIISKE